MVHKSLIQTIIKDHAGSSNLVKPRQDDNELKRNSKSNIYTWKYRLTTSEVAHIREKVEDVSQYFYSEEDW